MSKNHAELNHKLQMIFTLLASNNIKTMMLKVIQKIVKDIIIITRGIRKEVMDKTIPVKKILVRMRFLKKKLREQERIIVFITMEILFQGLICL